MLKWLELPTSAFWKGLNSSGQKISFFSLGYLPCSGMMHGTEQTIGSGDPNFGNGRIECYRVEISLVNKQQHHHENFPKS